MKTKLLFSLLLFATVVPGALAAGDDRENNTRTNSSQSLPIPVAHALSTNVSSGPAAVANDAKQAVQDYDSVMVAITQRFSATLAAIAEAVKRGDLSSDQATEMSGQQYELAQMQFELVSLWREIEQQDSASIPGVHEPADSRRENEIVIVALPFSSLQLNQLAEYLNLTESQLKAIHEVMMQEQKNLEPMMTELRITREASYDWQRAAQ